MAKLYFKRIPELWLSTLFWLYSHMTFLNLFKFEFVFVVTNIVAKLYSGVHLFSFNIYECFTHFSWISDFLIMNGKLTINMLFVVFFLQSSRENSKFPHHHHHYQQGSKSKIFGFLRKGNFNPCSNECNECDSLLACGKLLQYLVVQCSNCDKTVAILNWIQKCIIPNRFLLQQRSIESQEKQTDAHRILGQQKLSDTKYPW